MPDEPERTHEEIEARMKDTIRRFAKLPHKTQAEFHKELHESGRVTPKPRKHEADDEGKD
jgi:hypothetical protein